MSTAQLQQKFKKVGENLAVLSNQDGFTVFQFGPHTIHFRAPYSLERYTEIKEWDNGYLVIMAKGAHSLGPILKNLFFDTAAI